MLKHIKSLWTKENGAAAVEYGLLVALIAAVVLVAVTNLGTVVSSIFSSVAAKI